MSKKNIRRRKVKSNPNPKHPIMLDRERHAILTRIRQKMVVPEKEVTADMIASEMGFSPNYIRQCLARRAYTSLDRYAQIEQIVDMIQTERVR